MSRSHRSATDRHERTGTRMSNYPHVAIDGPVASGKTTAARAVARRLGALYLDTGAMYRALALAALRSGVDPGDEAALLWLARTHPIGVELDVDAPLGFRIRCGSTEMGQELFSVQVEEIVSTVAAQPAVRTEMVEQQREIASRGRVVMAGRDIGTVVLPDAPFKIFLTASVSARVARRAAELAAAGTPVDPAVLRGQIEERDRLDASRAVAPLRPAADAVVLDSSDLGEAEVVDRITALVACGAASP
jgi:cytidylate kinase